MERLTFVMHHSVVGEAAEERGDVALGGDIQVPSDGLRHRCHQGDSCEHGVRAPDTTSRQSARRGGGLRSRPLPPHHPFDPPPLRFSLSHPRPPPPPTHPSHPPPHPPPPPP